MGGGGGVPKLGRGCGTLQAVQYGCRVFGRFFNGVSYGCGAVCLLVVAMDRGCDLADGKGGCVGVCRVFWGLHSTCVGRFFLNETRLFFVQSGVFLVW